MNFVLSLSDGNGQVLKVRATHQPNHTNSRCAYSSNKKMQAVNESFHCLLSCAILRGYLKVRPLMLFRLSSSSVVPKKDQEQGVLMTSHSISIIMLRRI